MQVLLFGTPRGRTAFTICICRAQCVSRYCGKKLSLENNSVQKLPDAWVLLVLCWQSLLDSWGVGLVFFFLIFLSHFPCHPQKTVRQLCIPVLEDGEGETTEMLL